MTDDKLEAITKELVELYGEKLYGYAEHQPKIFNHYLKMYQHYKNLKGEPIS